MARRVARPSGAALARVLVVGAAFLAVAMVAWFALRSSATPARLVLSPSEPLPLVDAVLIEPTRQRLPFKRVWDSYLLEQSKERLPAFTTARDGVAAAHAWLRREFSETIDEVDLRLLRDARDDHGLGWVAFLETCGGIDTSFSVMFSASTRNDLIYVDLRKLTPVSGARQRVIPQMEAEAAADRKVAETPNVMTRRKPLDRAILVYVPKDYFTGGSGNSGSTLTVAELRPVWVFRNDGELFWHGPQVDGHSGKVLVGICETGSDG